ncbi:glycosyltransferase like family 2-domain-containing protein [Aspergillus coremiiformis]|uniref:Glycosyltransferase like family 2-domain-containing protein n=1 Tax=Aspergillus coremiiformis TaxID=138285 RepID=A0A5N6YVD2_9EURO|nr:glycosyltransferase like family 2-domain-containing protein [Aspergillus coremiiformis]
MTSEDVVKVEELPPDARVLSGQRYRKYLYHTARVGVWTFYCYFLARLLLILSEAQRPWQMWVMLAVEGLFGRLSYQDQCLTVAAGGEPERGPRKRLRLRGSQNLPRVDILIPCCGEPANVILDTVRSACMMDYPLSQYRVLVLDDGASSQLHDAISELHSKWPHLSYHTRGRQSGRVFAKAGNLNYALFTIQKDVPPDFCAILDADSIPKPEFLRATLPHLLVSPQVALVTTRQYFDNLPAGDPLSQSRRHFYTCQNAELDRCGRAIDAGSGAVFRRKAIIDVGGYPTFSFSEDWQLSLILRGMGYRTVQVQEPLQFGLVPTSLEGHIAQRNRWHIGHSQQVFALRPPANRSMPRHLQWSIARGGLAITLGLVGHIIGFGAVPCLVTSRSLIPASSSFVIKAQVILSMFYVSTLWAYGWLQNAHAGIRGSPFSQLENSWLAAVHLYAVIRFHFISNAPKGSFVTGSRENSWNRIAKSSVYKIESLPTRFLTTMAWPPLLHICYLTITNHWVPVAYLLNPPVYPARIS